MEIQTATLSNRNTNCIGQSSPLQVVSETRGNTLSVTHKQTNK